MARRNRYFQATYPSRCPICQKPIRIGQMVCYSKRAARHPSHMSCADEQPHKGTDHVRTHLECNGTEVRVVVIGPADQKLIHDHAFPAELHGGWQAGHLMDRIKASGKRWEHFEKSPHWHDPDDLCWDIESEAALMIWESLLESMSECSEGNPYLD